MTATETEYKGHKMLELTYINAKGTEVKVSMGLTKINAVLNNEAQCKAFAKKYATAKAVVSPLVI